MRWGHDQASNPGDDKDGENDLDHCHQHHGQHCRQYSGGGDCEQDDDDGDDVKHDCADDDHVYGSSNDSNNSYRDARKAADEQAAYETAVTFGTAPGNCR